ncbi:MAG: PAS domain S-box protein [Polyangiales bacterium]
MSEEDTASTAPPKVALDPPDAASLSRLFRTVMDQSVELIGVLDVEGNLIEANQTSVAMLGVTKESLLGRPFWECGWWTHSPALQARLREAIARAARGLPDRFESTHPRADGELEIVDFALTPSFGSDGRVDYLIPEGRVVTAERRAIEALALERKRLASILEGTDSGTWEWNVQTGETIFNERWASICGYTLDELAPISIETWNRLAHPDDLKLSGALLERHFSGELPRYEAELRMRHKDGRWIWVLDRGRVYEWTSDGRPLRMAGTHQEITARKEQERLLARLSRVARETTNGVVITDRHGVTEWANEGFSRMTGFSAEEVIGRRPGELLQGPETNPATVAQMRDAIAAGRGFEVELVNYTKAGVPYWLQILCTPLYEPDGSLQGFIAIESDIGERKRLETARARSEALLREMGHAAGVGGWSVDLRTNELLWTEVTRKIHEVPDDFVPRLESAIHFYAPEARPIIQRAVEAAMREGTPWDLELPLDTATGRRVWVRAVGRVDHQDGRPVRVLGSFQDITEQRARAAALKDERDRTQRYLDTVQTVMVALDLHGRITMVNRRGRELLGWSESELLGRDWFATCGGSNVESQHERFDRLMRGTQPVPEYTEATIRCRDGRERLLAWHLAVETDAEGRRVGMLCSGEDITGRRELEQRANRAQRLEAIGTMAGGIAHDLNNALSPIAMSLDLLRESAPGEAELLAMLARSTTHATGIVRQLLAFARGAEGQRVPLDPGVLVRDVESIVHSLFPKNITLRVERDASLPPVDGDMTQLHQVLLNLCMNARDAMADGGVLTLGASTTTLTGPPPGTVVGGRCPPGRYVVLRVSDTGSGITPATLERIFEPFFTTKPPDKGTGLGLSMVVGITRSHGGAVRVRSEPGVGTTFEVFLPASHSAANVAKVRGRDGTLRGRGELVLYVDDEEPVRTVAARVLTRLGFQCLTAPDAAAGRQLLAAHGDAVRVVITDLHMPEVDGFAFAQGVRATAPALPIIVASGRLDDVTQRAFDRLGRCTRLDKPFSEDSLAEALKAALSPPEAPTARTAPAQPAPREG